MRGYTPDEGHIEHIGFDGPYKPPRPRRFTSGEVATKRKAIRRRKYYDEDIPSVEVNPGLRKFLSLRQAPMMEFRDKPGFKTWNRIGIPDGMSRAEAEKAWDAARQQARKDFEKLWKIMNT